MTGQVTASDSFTVLGQTSSGKVVTTADMNEGTYNVSSYYYSYECVDSRYECQVWWYGCAQYGYSCYEYAWVKHSDGSPAYTLVVDRTPPAAGALGLVADYYHGAITDNMAIGPYGIKNILVNVLSDTNGIASVQFESFNPSDGSVYYAVPAWYDASTQTAGIGTGQSGSVAVGAHLPDPGGPLGLRFIIYDISGNRRVIENTVGYDLEPPAMVSWQYYRSDTGWSELTAGDLALRSNAPVAVSKIRVVVEPRNYDQVFVEPVSGTCTIPVGQTECTLDADIIPTPETVKLHNTYCYVKDPNNFTASPSKQTIFEWDLISPSIASYTLDRGNNAVSFQINEPQTGAFEGAVGVAGGWLLAHNSVTGQEMEVNGAITGVEGDTHQVTVYYASLPEGNWQFTLWAQDNFGNTGSQSMGLVAVDQTSPTVQIYKDAEVMSDHAEVADLSRVGFTVSDNTDPSPQVQGVRLTGGPRNMEVNLTYHQQDGAYVLDYPLMFPSMGADYALAVSVQDLSGNLATKTVLFSYTPPEIKITSTGQETLNLPAIPANVVHADGGNALASSVITLGGAPLTGTYDLALMSKSTSTTTLVVQGVSLAPGEQKILAGYDFAAAGGRLDLPMRAEGPGRVDLLITIAAPSYPLVTAPVNFWRPEVQVSADPGWAVQPLIQKQRLSMVKGAGTPCRITASRQEAQAADPVNAPVCLVQWTELPANYQASANYVEGVLPPTGDYTPGYEIYIFNNGQPYRMASGAGQTLLRSPVQDLAFTVATAPAAPMYRQVQDIAVRLQSRGSYQCPAVVTTLAEAQDQGAQQVVCLVRWPAMPEGLQPAAPTSGATAQLSGNFTQAGDQEAAWAVDLYSPYGTMDNAAAGRVTLSVLNPPLPELAFEAGLYGEKLNDDLYIMSELQGGEFGKIKFGTKLANTNMTLELNGTDEGHTSRQYISANNVTFTRNLKTGELGLWENRQVTAKLYYTNLPDWMVEKQITVMGVPSKRIRATLTAMNQTLDTTGVPVQLAVGIPAAQNQTIYNSLTDGAWKGRFGYLDKKNEFQPLTDYQSLMNGVLETTLTGFGIGFQKLKAEVELTPPESAAFYSRSLKTNNAYSTVLKGTAPAGEIYSRTLTGPAPLNAVMSLQVESDTRRIMGEIVWQLSADDGATWETLASKSPYQVTATVNAGTYIVRVQMSNQLSGAVGYSEGVQLIAYKVPQLEVSAPAAVIVGTPVTLRALVTVDGQPAAEDVVIEWYNRAGEKVFTGASYEITSADTTSLLYTVQAKTTLAPETDGPAWIRKNVYVRVVPPKAPTGLIAVPNYMEYNLVSAKTYVATAKLNLASGLDPAMYPIRGEWRLPDGNVVEGSELAYSPMAQDAEKRQALFEYVAWIEGCKEQTQATFRRAVTVGTYDWPEFRVEVKTAPEVAPSLVTLTASPESGYTGKLEKPAYVWQLPASAQLVREQDHGRVMQVTFAEAGSFEVEVTVTDARGATAEAGGTVALGEPDPFQVEFMPLFSNSLHRELLDVTLRANVRGGHPQDRLSTYEFSINSPDAQVTSFTGSGVIKGLKAGNYLAQLRALSKLGKVVEADYPLSVIANQPPTCQVTTWESGDYLWWKAVCSDADGRVAGYRWYQDDKLISSGQAIRVKKSDLTGMLRFEAIDDAQGKYSENLVGSAPAN